MNWSKKILDHYVDDNGNYKLGVENGMIPEELLELMKLPSLKKTAADREIYQLARMGLNAFMIKVTREGYPSGSCSRSPSLYFIAKNKEERRMLLNKTSKNIIGRLQLTKLRGEDLISDRAINKVQKQLEEFIPPEVI